MATVAKNKPKGKPKPDAGKGGGVKAALTRKIGPLPAWAWLAGLALVALWWRRSHSSAATSSSGQSDTAGVTGGGTGGGGSPSGGGGDSGSSGGDTGATTPTTGASVTDVSSNVPAALPFSLRSAILPRGTSQPLNAGADPFSRMVGGRLVQPLQWDGQTFYSQASFEQWAKSHGTSAQAILSKHPSASNIFGQLAPAPSAARPAAGVAAKASSATAVSRSARQVAGAAPAVAHRVAAKRTKKPKAAKR